ncbi:hypothetical protein OGAPHI_007118 [Ogataea philodendri]|uniref:Pyrimidine 5-nucleotidase n=1 Tax=Ogataea philodendri TaxID=1378263 RepID=A0A9P8NW38_9ASCO|nr:uncharacterized protein OGAPHI_007118 [Ogataea philodendri]KAH3660532.1 hypothetical protein OGAPHI_007118 [Ogataea philodendri]
MALKLNDLDEVRHMESRLGDESPDVRKEREILSRNSQSQVHLGEDQTEVDKLRKNLPLVNLKYGAGPVPLDDKKVFFFDIDNCLYQRSTRIHDLMQVYIHRFFKERLHLNDHEAHALHMKYYKEYGLAIEGLVRLHKIDALEYNKVVDDALPLDMILRPNPQLRDMLLRMKKSGKVDRLWLYTNAYKTHGLRVIRLLGLGDIFDGITFCDYTEFPLKCKPMKESFDRALRDAGVRDPRNAYFVDDSGLNVVAAKKFGWGKIIQFVELDEDMEQLTTGTSDERDGITIIRDILELEQVCSELF